MLTGPKPLAARPSHALISPVLVLVSSFTDAAMDRVESHEPLCMRAPLTSSRYVPPPTAETSSSSPGVYVPPQFFPANAVATSSFAMAAVNMISEPTASWRSHVRYDG
jgi:hypothetical protein